MYGLPKLIIGLVVALPNCVGATELPTAAGTATIPAHIAAAVAAPDRPAEDRARDADRRPAEILTFFGIERGATVAELMTGRGYYAELLARAVGPEGKVYAQNNAFVLDRFARSAITERLARPGLGNVVRLDSELDALDLPAGQLDAVLMILFYHDTYWMEVDRSAMNRAVYLALKPGGVYAVVDHHAAAGSGERNVKSLHRMEASLAKREILEAGFTFVSESDLLRHPDDDRTKSVFDDTIRGKTDRFVYLFRRP